MYDMNEFIKIKEKKRYTIDNKCVSNIRCGCWQHWQPRNIVSLL